MIISKDPIEVQQSKNFESLMGIYEQWKSKNRPKSKGASLAVLYFLFYHGKKFGVSQKLTSLCYEELWEQPLLLLETLEKNQFKKVKGKAKQALMEWFISCLNESSSNSNDNNDDDGANHQWNFKLIDYIPSALEILGDQKQGVRPLSLIFQKDFAPIFNKSDCLEFFLHDLEHGYMFFSCSNLKKQQQLFFSQIDLSLQLNMWPQELWNCPDFTAGFHYAISDMNAHPQHYKQFLKALLPIEKAHIVDDVFNLQLE